LAADDEASNGSAEHALALASALVCVARLGAHRAPSPLASSLVADQSDLEGRVSRLLTAGPRSHRRSKPWFMAAGATLLVLAAIRAGAHPAVQSAVHEMLEFLVRS
jgi:hypothetical protein